MNVASLKIYSKAVRSKSRPWDDQELADFYRATEILRQAGLNTESDLGLTDEGDPWFVFVRPESGDVIAHFARIDGQFLAVSSLNQEVYRGNNIREIVDRMLTRHPSLLPYNKSDNQLFLHPTAALTAFLAAAFFLTIDGIKPTNLKEILVEAESLSKENNKTAEIQIPVVAKTDFFKTISFDLTSINYNAAVHGMALIASEFGYKDDNKNEPEFSSDRAIDLAPLEGEGSNVALYIVGANQHQEQSFNQQSLRNSNAVEQLFSADHSAINFQDEKIDKSLGDKESKNDAHSQIIQDAAKNLSVIQTEAGEFWSDSYLPVRTSYQVSHADKALNAAGPPHSFEKVAGEFDEDSNTLVSQNLAGGSQVGGEKGEENVSLKYGSFSEHVGLVDGNLLLVDLKDDLVFLESSPVNMKNSALTVFDPELVNGYPVQPIVELDDVESNPQPNFSIKTPILGHSFKDPGHVLQMTDAIDVVFYKGGDAEIAGFELGKDLFWSFLSPNHLQQARKTINDEGDLILDFGAVGTLSLIGVVPDATHDLVV
jgi:hypothetical protein